MTALDDFLAAEDTVRARERCAEWWDEADDLGVAPTTAPVAWWCPACDEPAYIGEPEDGCEECGWSA